MPPKRRRSVRNGGLSDAAQGDEGDQGSSALLREWQILMADMQARMANQEEELRQLRQQVRTANSGNGGALAAVAAGTGSHWEALYERFRKQQPPVFVGGLDPSQAEQWMSRIISILDFMRMTVNDKMGMCCLGTAEDVCITWEAVTRDAYHSRDRRYPYIFLFLGEARSWLGIAATKGVSVVCKIQGVRS